MFDSIVTLFKELNRKIIPVLVYVPEALAERLAGASAGARIYKGVWECWWLGKTKARWLWINFNRYLI